MTLKHEKPLIAWPARGCASFGSDSLSRQPNRRVKMLPYFIFVKPQESYSLFVTIPVAHGRTFPSPSSDVLVARCVHIVYAKLVILLRIVSC